MPVEIERKFLLSADPPLSQGTDMAQGYLCKDPERTVRVRIEGDRAVLTVKGRPVGVDSITRPEFEYEIPVEDARALLKMCSGGVVEKTRHYHPMGSHVWEVDVFHGANRGLMIAEIELSAEDEAFEKPDWLGAEVSGDPRYFNSSLSTTPYMEC